MKVTQIYQIVNTMASEILGAQAIVNEDLSNVVDMGREMLNSTDIDRFTKKLVDKVGKTVFVDRVYKGSAPSVFMDAWEFGSVLEKIQADIPVASENSSWDLTDGATYNQDIFYQPSVSAKFFNDKVTFEVPMSFTELQVKSAFTSVTALNGFLTMLYNAVDKALTIRQDALVMRTINNMTANTLLDDIPDKIWAGKTGVKAVNLLKLYNDAYATQIDANDAIVDTEFMKFASYQIGMYISRLQKMSTLFNVGKKERFTPADELHVVMLTNFANSAKVFLQADTFNKDLVALPSYEEVPFWQGSGTGYAFNDVSSINVGIKTESGVETISAGGIVAVAFDRYALAITNMDKRVTTHYNAKSEFFNNYYKIDCGTFNDLNENFVVFYIA